MSVFKFNIVVLLLFIYNIFLLMFFYEYFLNIYFLDKYYTVQLIFSIKYYFQINCSIFGFNKHCKIVILMFRGAMCLD